MSFTSASVTPTGTGQTLAEGPEMRKPEGHLFAFATSDTTVEILTRLKRIQSYAFGYAGSPAATEAPLSIDETVSDFGEIIVPDGGAITVKRPAGTTSGLKCSLVLFGY